MTRKQRHFKWSVSQLERILGWYFSCNNQSRNFILYRRQEVSSVCTVLLFSCQKGQHIESWELQVCLAKMLAGELWWWVIYCLLLNNTNVILRPSFLQDICSSLSSCQREEFLSLLSQGQWGSTQPSCWAVQQSLLPCSSRSAVRRNVSACWASRRAVPKCLSMISPLWSLLSHSSVPSNTTACRSIRVTRGISSGTVMLFCGALMVPGIE